MDLVGGTAGKPGTGRAWAVAGLSEFDEALYVRILRQPRIGPSGWARALGVSESAVHQASDRLAEVGLLRRSDSNGAIRAVDPRRAANALIRKRRAESDRLAAAAERLAEMFEHGMLRSDPSRLIEVVQGGGNVDAVGGLVHARHEVSVLHAPPSLVRMALHGDEQRQAPCGEAEIRVLCAAADPDLPEMLAFARWMRPEGEHIRVLPAVPLKLVLIDRRTALLPLISDEAGAEPSIMVVRESALTDALQALFEVLWRQAVPLWDHSDTPPEATEAGELTDAERSLVGLLAVGMKDEAIARHLDISVRTLRRRIGDLQARLGAGGRFQAGVQAARRGWT
ncbi:LuxR C-terminal-related transcriptional regulator [Micromonospora sp. NPDC005173]|uniref:LuxR C-terminal-related transcriptional regulator n=1 Tax=Micromonospora sp. NPDC005173 TaxID=3157165 RepID=UPI0033AC1032